MRIYAREGVDIARSTMVDWVAHSAALLDPLVAALRRYALSAAKLHSDDTPVKVLDPGRGKTKTARFNRIEQLLPWNMAQANELDAPPKAA